MPAPHVLHGLPAPLWQLVEQIGALAGQRHIRAALVGGVVRDLLFGLPLPPDEELDVLVEGDGPAFAGLLARELHGSLREHAAFLTARVDWTEADGTARHMDVATARAERYLSPGALPLVSPAPLEQDLARRDFTINAMAIRIDPPHTGQLLDPFAGRRDLAARQLRVLHGRSFEDDPTRMFRAARFAARYGLELDATSLAQLTRALPTLHRVSGARIRHELALVATERDPAAGLARLDAWSVLAAIHPLLTADAAKRDLVHRIFEPALQPWRAAADPFLLVACALLYDRPAGTLTYLGQRIGLSAPELKRCSKTATALAACTATLSKQQPRLSALYTHLASLPPEGLCLLAAMGGDASRQRMKNALERGGTVPLSGGDLLALGVPSGITCGRILQHLRTAWIDGLVHDRDGLVELARQYACGTLSDDASRTALQGLHPDRLPCTKKDTVYNGQWPRGTEK